MKILYVAGRWDPTVQNEYSGSDYGAYHMLKKQPGVEIALVEPIDDQPKLLEKIILKLYGLFFKKRLIKYNPSALRKTGRRVDRAIAEFQPDVIFSKYSAPMVHATIDRPFVYMCDSTVKWTKEIWPTFSKLGFLIMEKWEGKSIRACDRLVTFSHASAQVIQSHYQKDPKKISVFPIPAYIPENLIPSIDTIDHSISDPLKLLLVGKRYHLRGIDIGIQVANLLNEMGCPTVLHIVGMKGEDQQNVKFLGVFNKEEPAQISAYFENFTWADLLIHPSRFHSAGMVISEAAAFGLPTITNASGGLATTVQHDKTGIVLPAESPARAYADAILALIADPARYQNYRVAARTRFDTQLNWERAGERLFDLIKEVVP